MIAVELLCWEGFCLGVWLITLSSVSMPELVTAIASSVPCAMATVATRRVLAGSWRPRAVWLRWLMLLPVAVVADAARVLALPLRRAGQVDECASFRQHPLSHFDNPAREAAWQAISVLAVSATPGSYVVDVDPSRDRVLLHSLVGGAPDMTKVVQR